MGYRERPASPALARWIRCFWLLDGLPDSEPERLVPDGSPELVVNLADPFCQVHNDGRRQPHPRMLLVGQLRSAIDIAPLGAVHLLGVRFWPGGMFPLLRLPQHRLLGQRTELAGVDADLQAALLAAAETAVGFEQACARFERLLLPRLSGLPPSPVEQAVQLLVAAEGALRLDALAGHCGLSARSLERGFRREVGLGPKLLARILRFQRVFRTGQDGPDSWAMLAVRAGYCDQAHLIRDFRLFSGASPTRWGWSAQSLAACFARPDGRG